MLLPNSELKRHGSTSIAIGATELPSDFPSLIESVANSLKDGYCDHCFKMSQLKEIADICHDKKVSFFYTIAYNKYCEIDYIKIVPVQFQSVINPRKKLNIQCAFHEIPKEYDFIITGISEN